MESQISWERPKYVYSHFKRFLNPYYSDAYEKIVEEGNPWILREAANNLSDVYARELRYLADFIEDAQNLR